MPLKDFIDDPWNLLSGFILQHLWLNIDGNEDVSVRTLKPSSSVSPWERPRAQTANRGEEVLFGGAPQAKSPISSPACLKGGPGGRRYSFHEAEKAG